MCSPSSRAQWTCIRGLFSSRTEDNELLPVFVKQLYRLLQDLTGVRNRFLV
jgi:hypothetical protein